MAANDCTSFIRIYYVLTTDTAQNAISIVHSMPKRNTHTQITESWRERRTDNKCVSQQENEKKNPQQQQRRKNLYITGLISNAANTHQCTLHGSQRLAYCIVFLPFFLLSLLCFSWHRLASNFCFSLLLSFSTLFVCCSLMHANFRIFLLIPADKFIIICLTDPQSCELQHTLKSCKTTSA